MHKNAANSDQVGSLNHARGRIPRQSASDTAILISSLDSQATQHDDRHGVRHVAPEAARGLLYIHGAGRESVISNDALIITDDVSA